MTDWVREPPIPTAAKGLDDLEVAVPPGRKVNEDEYAAHDSILNSINGIPTKWVRWASKNKFHKVAEKLKGFEPWVPFRVWAAARGVNWRPSLLDEIDEVRVGGGWEPAELVDTARHHCSAFTLAHF